VSCDAQVELTVDVAPALDALHRAASAAFVAAHAEEFAKACYEAAFVDGWEDERGASRECGLQVGRAAAALAYRLLASRACP
jgi:hypothetical protein